MSILLSVHYCLCTIHHRKVWQNVQVAQETISTMSLGSLLGWSLWLDRFSQTSCQIMCSRLSTVFCTSSSECESVLMKVCCTWQSSCYLVAGFLDVFVRYVGSGLLYFHCYSRPINSELPKFQLFVLSGHVPSFWLVTHGQSTLNLHRSKYYCTCLVQNLFSL